MSMTWMYKISSRLPRLLALAAAGDPTAIAMLALLGDGALYTVLKKK